MLASYIDKAMESATYEIIEEDQTYWGEIPLLLAKVIVSSSALLFSKS